MKMTLLFTASTLVLLFACARQQAIVDPPIDQPPMGENPFFSEWGTPFDTPPFGKIKEEHYMPAFKEGMKRHKAEIDTIAGNSEAPTFANTIEALEKSGDMLTRVSYVFENLNSAHTNDTLQEIAKEKAPLISKHEDDINLNEKLFERVKALYANKENLNLIAEQEKVLERYYKDFVRGGANLGDEEKARFRKINEELSLLSLQFGENLLNVDNKFKLVIHDEDDLAGLPESVVTAATEAAKEAGEEGKWVITLHKSSWIPFLQYSEKRDLREAVYRAWMNRGNNNDELDNKEILAKMTALRLERAKLLGYETHSHYILEENMAKMPEAVYTLLEKLWPPALAKAREEVGQMQALIREEGSDFALASWDWWHYAEKVRKARYALDEEEIRPYFKLENVIQGVFDLSTKLFGITFEERTDLPTYHEDVKTFEVLETDGSHLGILYTDYFPRASKRGGAWMNNFRDQSKMGGDEVRPIIVNCGNFTKPTKEKPSLLSLDEVKTLFHEFGHAVHGMLADTTYPRLSGTSVPRDFVEFPSQVMENWALEPEVLAMYARHYETGELIPDALIEKIKKSSRFNQGFATVEYLATAFLDMDYHTITEPITVDAVTFERRSMDKLGLIPQIIPRWRSTYLRHAFVHGYSSGYYSYIWAEVLDADAFAAFKAAGIFDKELALAFRENILEKGGTEDPMLLYKRFRGAEPEIEPLLKKRGLD